MAQSSHFLDIQQIQKRIPHRFPFLLIDRVLSYTPGPSPDSFKGRKLVARKNVSVNESYFSGHFPDQPVMPGVLQVEAMAQAGALACAPDDNDSVDVLLAKIDNAKFKKVVTPGDILEIRVEITGEKAGLLTVVCECFCEDQLVSQATVMAKVVKK
jgi:beta-hydroxyacyl-ACP dehydratase FabZ